MSLVTVKYFVGEINIVNWNEKPVCERLTLMIKTREDEYLEYALGYDFAQKVIAGIAANTPKYLLLKNGGLYKHSSGHTARFNGLAKDELTPSPIANYVYYWWCRDNSSQSTTMGEVDTKTEAKKVSANSKAVRAFNVAAREAKKLWDVLLNSVTEDGEKMYPDFNSQCVSANSLKVINVFGI